MGSVNLESIHADFEPKEDITAYELAKLLPYINPYAVPLYEDDWVKLGTATRHLKRLKSDELI